MFFGALKQNKVGSWRFQSHFLVWQKYVELEIEVAVRAFVTS